MYGNTTKGQIKMAAFLEPFWKHRGWKNQIMAASLQLGMPALFLASLSPNNLLQNAASLGAGAVGVAVIQAKRDQGYQIKFSSNGVSGITKQSANVFLRKFFRRDLVRCSDIFR